ncbi:MAG: hypothetical protein HOH74_27910 [Gemmatimonadetes bacterium]|nr:hypothetical protein [Gemmatimonadota bacterium]
MSIRAIDAQGNPWTAGAEVHLYTTTPLAALQQALPHRKFLVKTLFACLSEPRPWTGLPREGSIEAWFQQHRMGNQLEQLFTAVDDALRLDPVDEQMQQYEQWLYRARIRPELKTPILSDDSPDAPQWARWARAAWLTARRVPAWWLDHRLVETGEFGGAVGDDTDLYQNFVDFAYFESGGVAARLQEAAARLAHLAELTTLTGGINRSTMDPLHAYEEGLNQEALMAAWTYGDPVYLERCMAAARSVADVTVVTDRGHRHFRSQLIGEDARADTTTDVDGQAHPSMWHPALEVLWYNEHPVISQWLQEWADGWLDHFEPGRYAHAVDVASERVEGANQRPLYGGYGGQGSAFAFLATITGDRDYAAPFFEAYSAGQTSTSPADLILDLLHRFGADAFGGHLETLPLQGPAAAVVHGDLDALVEALQQDVAEIETFERMYTSAEPFTDRIFLSAIRNASICYTGGYASRNKFNRSHAVSWSGFSTDYAAFVERAGPESFRARLYNFSKARRLGAARFWQLAHGRYRIHRGPDADDDGRIDGQAETEDVIIRRGEPIDIDLQPGGSVIEVELLEALPSLQSEADLALSPLDITIVGDAILGSVHNIGRKSAHAVVTLTPAGGGAAQQIDLGQIDPPDDLVPRRQAFRFDGLSRSDLDGIIEVDAQHVVSEITELNNVVDLRQIHQTLRWQGEVETAIAPQRTD